MDEDQTELAAGLARFDEFLQGEYGLPLAAWSQPRAWTARERLQLSRAVGLLLKAPIVDTQPLAGESDIGALRLWSFSETKFAASDWEQSWQWRLLADIDNSSRDESQRMMTPSDPRLFLLRIRYERDMFALVAGHMLTFFCDRAAGAIGVEAGSPPSPEIAAALRRLPGFETADMAFIAGLAVLVGKLGRTAFCDWCDERASAPKDDEL